MAISTEHFTRALSITHLQEEASADDRMSAEQYLMLLRAHPDGLNLAFHIVSNEDFNDIRCFWAFNTIIHHVPEIASSISAEQSMLLYQTLFSWLQRHCQTTPLPDFIINKHAQMMVVGIQEFYPARWATVFEDLFQLLVKRETWSHARDQLTLYFLRVFQYIDERVVCVRSQTARTRDQRQRDMEVKDVMREHVIVNAVSAWYQILCEYRLRTPEIAKVCLDVVQAYVEWIDIHLIVTADWMHLLYFFTTVPHLRQAGCDCLYNIVVKKQLAQVKVDTLVAMGIVDALPRIVVMVPSPTTEEEETFLLSVVTLANGIAEQLLPCAESGIERCAELLHLVVVEVVKLFSIANFQVREITLPFVQLFIKSSVIGEHEAGDLLHLVFRHTIQASHDLIAAQEAQEQAIVDEMIDQRKVLHNIIRLIQRRYPQIVLEHCSRVVYQVVSVSSTDQLPSCEAEGAMRYLYELGESMKMEVLKDASAPFAQMIFHILHCPHITGHPDSSVHLAYFELVERFSSFFVHHRDQVPLILQQFLLMPCGVVNPNDRVRSRVCYLFGKLLQVLKLQFAPHAEDIVRAVQSVFQRAALQSSDKLDLYEGIGTVLSVSDPAVCISVADGVLQHMHQLNAEQRAADAVRCDAMATQVSEDIAYLSHLAKGVAGSEAATKVPDSPPLASKDGGSFPPVQQLPVASADSTLSSSSMIGSSTGPLQAFYQVTLDVMQTLELWWQSPLVRDRSCLFMHQMVNILSHNTLSDVFETFASRMLQWAVAANELPKILRVVYQFVNRTRAGSIPILSRMIPMFHARVNQLCCELQFVRSEMGVVSEYVKEQAEVYRSYFSVIHAVVHCSCLPALFTDPAASVMGTLLSQLVAASQVSAEFELPKQALQILSRLTFQQCGEPGFEALTSFMVETAVPHLFNVVSHATFDLKDAKNFFLVSELCQLLKYLIQKMGDAGLQSLYTLMMNPPLALTAEESGAVCTRLRDEPRASAQFKSSFRQLLEIAQSRRPV